ncbi:MAG: FAD-binding protein [Coriobacteriales bacterium]|jgi:fumarate reductase flavoprotein subunit|nr:FAD-binding protein [Coriobacteriales bacterium]
MELDRRMFIKSSLAAGAAALAGGAVLAGCTPQSGGDGTAGGDAAGAGTGADPGGSTSTEYVPSYMRRDPVGEPEETVTADFVICGGGGCGVAALLQADDLGLNAILLEKKQSLGGTFAFAAVGFFPNNKYAIEVGKEVDYNDLIKTIMTYNHYIPDYTLLKNFMNECPETFDWCESLGGQFMYMAPQEGAMGPFGLGVNAMYAGESDGAGTGGGAALIKVLIGEAERRGLDVRCDTPAKELVQDESGAVTGVLAVDDSGKVIKFEAPAVLLCTGGWGNNPDFIRELGRVDPDRVISPGYDGRDGDGVYMARKAGAAWARGDGTMMFYGPHLPGPIWGEAVSNGVYQPTLWVNEKGRRFMNEGLGNFAETGNAIRDVKRLFVIQSAADIDIITADNGIAGFNGQGGSEGPQDKYKTLLEEEIARGNDRIYVADTIEALAMAAGIDAASLQATVDRYNELVAKGVDEDFQKGPQYLTACEEGPFHAFECDDGFFTTIGGVKIDEDICAIDDNGDVIEGLYVAGCDTGALCGDIYDFTSAPGEQSSWALASGRLVAKHVAAKLKG